MILLPNNCEVSVYFMATVTLLKADTHHRNIGQKLTIDTLNFILPFSTLEFGVLINRSNIIGRFTHRVGIKETADWVNA